MKFNLNNPFFKTPINEPFLSLEDSRWAELEGGYRVLYDASIALKRLEGAKNSKETEEIYNELWDELHHQGDVGVASYYSVPHMVRIAKENNIVDWNVLGLVSLIEIQRHKNNPDIPQALLQAYRYAITELSTLVMSIVSENWDLNMTTTALTAIAVAKGQIKFGNAVQELDDENRIDDFLKQHQ